MSLPLHIQKHILFVFCSHSVFPFFILKSELGNIFIEPLVTVHVCTAVVFLTEESQVSEGVMTSELLLNPSLNHFRPLTL